MAKIGDQQVSKRDHEGAEALVEASRLAVSLVNRTCHRFPLPLGRILDVVPFTRDRISGRRSSSLRPMGRASLFGVCSENGAAYVRGALLPAR